jgi:hypothetical protein
MIHVLKEYFMKNQLYFILLLLILILLFFSCSPVDNNPEHTPASETTPHNIAFGLGVSTSVFYGTRPADLGNATDGDDETSTTAGMTSGAGTEGFTMLNLGK